MTCRATGCDRGPVAKGLCHRHHNAAARLGLLGPCERCERQVGALSTVMHQPHDEATWFATLTPAELAAWNKGYLDAIERRYDTTHIDVVLAGLLG